MLKKTFCTQDSSADRHVSPVAPHRVCGALYALCLIVIGVGVGVGAWSYAEVSGDVAQLVQETDLREKPSEEAMSLGRLPTRTLVTLSGERQEGFFGVRVELDDGKIMEGWVAARSLEGAAQQGFEDEAPAADAQPEKPAPVEKKSVLPVKRTGRIRIPKDEGVLLRREQTFLYGVHGGWNFNVIQTDVDSYFYLGSGFSLGGDIGVFVAPNTAVRLELGYTLSEGTAQESGKTLQFGFFDIGVLGHYALDWFEFFGGIQYSMGISINDINQVSSSLAIESASAMSSLYLTAGAGYRFQLTDWVQLAVRGRYAFAFLRYPVGIQIIGLSLCLEFQG